MDSDIKTGSGSRLKALNPGLDAMVMRFIAVTESGSSLKFFPSRDECRTDKIPILVLQLNPDSELKFLIRWVGAELIGSRLKALNPGLDAMVMRFIAVTESGSSLKFFPSRDECRTDKIPILVLQLNPDSELKFLIRWVGAELIGSRYELKTGSRFKKKKPFFYISGMNAEPTKNQNQNWNWIRVRGLNFLFGIGAGLTGSGYGFKTESGPKAWISETRA